MDNADFTLLVQMCYVNLLILQRTVSQKDLCGVNE